MRRMRVTGRTAVGHHVAGIAVPPAGGFGPRRPGGRMDGQSVFEISPTATAGI